MPILKIQTNATLTKPQQDQILTDCSTLTAQQLAKPECYVMIMIEQKTNMIFDGNDSPAMYLEFKSIGLPEDQTAQISAALSQYFFDEIGMPANRIYIEFSNAQRHLWGWNGETF